MARELELAGQTYNIGTLDTMKQFHVARRLGPAIWALLISALGSVRQVAPEGGDTTIKDVFNKLNDAQFKNVFAGAIGPLVGILSSMDDETSEFVIKTCLGVVTRQQGQGWAPVQSKEGHFMFSDIDMTVMMQLVFATIRENLQNFTSALVLPV